MSEDDRFPEGFLWGAATSAYQIEGSPLADGAGPSIWQRFTHSPGLVKNGDTGDVACDHYRLWESDVRLMRELGLNAYRFSISWSRVLPEGRGRVNQPGIDFYSRLVDALLENGIQPLVTLYHWDLPAALDDRGGWLNPDIPGWFADYATVMYRALDDRVRMWATLNEPWVVTDGGYLHGALAPGHKNLWEAPLATHQLMRSHGAAVQAYRAEGKHQIGLVVNIEPKDPASDRPEDLAATKRAEAYMNRQFLDPAIHGRYPEEMREIFGEAWPDFPQSEIDQIRQPVDFLGINYYTRSVTCDDPNALPVRAGRVRQKRHAYTETDWEVYPPGLTNCLTWIKENYGDIPLYVTENGAAFYDPPSVEGDELSDPLRVDYFRTHLRAAREAMRQGVDLRGYFAWSLLDNFEWSLGYSKRFGIVHVDFETQRRTPKASARYYAEVIRRGGVA
ncbi:MAG TPA: GH1 family beta-glucosidase [Thermoanaerobaculia bacterium]|nr:GH1 family beta-glucosidase [Thermoanaerobaculia bacterium]